ncbi:MAG: GNAT family N-acetyltransferase [Candidatus Eisenbacteria bacterium]|nr:GNAT family N-acetyltransferase [Candidatus Eisenbacteria bacterium]
MTERETGAGPRFLMGSGVTLRRFERDDIKHVRRWLEDAELRAQIGATGPLDKGAADRWFEELEGDRSRAWYAVVRDEDDAVIGEAGLLRMCTEWRSTDMTIILGDPEARGRGHGTEAGRVLLEFAFEYMGFHRISVGVVGFNEEAVRFWEKLGFSREGVQRDGYLLDGQFHDFVMMSLLEDEWRAHRVVESARDGGDRTAD